MAEVYGQFDQASAARIAAVVRFVEAMMRNGAPTPSGRVPVGAQLELGKTDAAIAKGASGTVSVWKGVAGSETDSTNNITAYNRFGNVASGKWVMVARVNGNWYLIAAEC